MKRRRGNSPIVVASAFVAGALCMLFIVVATRHSPGVNRDEVVSPQTDAGSVERGNAPAASPTIGPLKPVVQPDEGHDRATAFDPSAPPTAVIADLRKRGLLIPLTGITPASLRSSFTEARSGGRSHEAIDILAPRHTPVRAVEDGTVAKLFQSKAGGTTIYQFDRTERYAYYYAHLQEYARGLREGVTVKRGQTIGYVGTSGNAPPDTPHLHFAVYALTEDKRWWEGAPVDPYLIWQD
jgi:murein DD-endopeptidase MepM/ murein hydrolase activator NlpD